MRILRTILLLVLVLSLAGCHMKTVPTESTGGLTVPSGDDTEICQTPPVLTLMHDHGSSETLLGTYSWNYDQGDGTWAGIEADAMHPLDCQDSLLPIGTENLYAELSFAVEPDAVTIRCWHDSQWGNYGAQAEAVEHYGNAFELLPGGISTKSLPHGPIMAEPSMARRTTPSMSRRGFTESCPSTSELLKNARTVCGWSGHF